MSCLAPEINVNDQRPKNIVVGVCGGIAAYKACHLIRAFKEQGNDVTVVPTRSALNFVGAATFEALSGNRISTSVFENVDQVQHVRVGKQADLIVVAPATADTLARIASGRCDDLLSATILVATCPIVIAPAMHTEMWLNRATQANVELLRSRGYVVLDPAHGRLTGEDSGPGRLPDPSQIFELSEAVLAGVNFDRCFAGKEILITAGGTRERIDPVRFLGNRSSGRQGFALAEVAAQRGAKVTVIAAHVDNLPTPLGAEVIEVDSAEDMLKQVNRNLGGKDAVIMAAAVADFRVVEQSGVKLKKTEDTTDVLTLSLTQNPDILASIVEKRAAGEIDSKLVIAGFAAETGDEHITALEFARAKLVRKGCDLLMCNEVGMSKVFGQRHNRGWILDSAGGTTVVPEGTKVEVASRILDEVVRVINSKTS